MDDSLARLASAEGTNFAGLSFSASTAVYVESHIVATPFLPTIVPAEEK